MRRRGFDGTPVSRRAGRTGGLRAGAPLRMACAGPAELKIPYVYR